MASNYINLPITGNPSWKDPVATAAALPASGNTIGDARVVEDTSLIYVWSGSAWVSTAPSGGVTSINSDSTAAQLLTVGTSGTDFAITNPGGGSHVFNLPDASATARGVVSTGTQTLAGAKTFSGALAGTTLSLSGQLTSTVATGSAPLVVASTTQVANLNAATAGSATSATTATTATTATNIAGGAGGSLPYQSAASTTALLANGSAGQLLKSAGGTSPPAWATDISQFGITIDGGGSVITTGLKGFVFVPFACTITANYIMADQSGSCVIDVWRRAFSSFPPTVTQTITASALPTLSSAQSSSDTTLTGWSVTCSANDVLAFNVNSATTVTRVTLTLKVSKL